MTVRAKTLARAALTNRIAQDESNGMSFEEILAKYADQGAIHT